MPRSSDFEKIYHRFTSQYGEREGKERYFSWVNKHRYNDEHPLPGKTAERKEKLCIVRGVELKEDHVRGLVATSHIDSNATNRFSITGPEIGIADYIPKETLESAAQQMNTTFGSRIMGVHHSEGLTGEYCGVADVEHTPATVVPLSDGKYGLYVDTKLLPHDTLAQTAKTGFTDGTYTGFSITYDAGDAFDFDWVEGELVRVLQPGIKIYGYTAASNPVNENALITSMDFKEFKEVMPSPEPLPSRAGTDGESHDRSTTTGPAASVANSAINANGEQPHQPSADTATTEATTMSQVTEPASTTQAAAPATEPTHPVELKEAITHLTEEVLKKVGERMEVKETILRDNASQTPGKEVSLEIKEFLAIVERPHEIEIKEQFRRAAAVSDKRYGPSMLDNARTTPVERREYKQFCIAKDGRSLEYKGLGITSNQNTDTDYLLSSAELQDMFDPVIYNLLNQQTVTWNLLEKDDYSKKGNNQVQFTAKYAVNASNGFYLNNAISTDRAKRLKFQTKFKKFAVGVSVDGDMIAAARGGPISDVFAQEVYDATLDMLSAINAQLFLTKGAETDAEIIGFEYIANSATYTSLYNLTRSSTTNLLNPDAASDTYITASSQRPTLVSHFRPAIKQAVVEGVKKTGLIWITHPTQGNLLRSKFDDQKMLVEPRATSFGFSTDLFIDGIPVFEDKDCPNSKWFLIDRETHRVGIWVPPTVEKLGKTGDSEDAFLKMYFAVYNRRPRALVEIYSCATS